MNFSTTYHDQNGPHFGRLYRNCLDVESFLATVIEGVHCFPVGRVVVHFFIFLTTCGRELVGIAIIISVAIVVIILIATAIVASLVIDYATAAISSTDSPIVYIIIVAASMAASATLAVEYASTATFSSWTLDMYYMINLLPTLVVEGEPNIIRDVDHIRGMITSNVAADSDL